MVPAAARIHGVDDDDRLLGDARYACPCGREARLPLAALAELAARWTREEDAHFEPEVALRFRPAERALLDHHQGAFLVQIACGCGAPASLVLKLEEQRGVERVVVLAVLVDVPDDLD